MASLQIHLFGSPRLELDNTPLSLGRRNTLALLAYLAVTGRPHRRESQLHSAMILAVLQACARGTKEGSRPK